MAEKHLHWWEAIHSPQSSISPKLRWKILRGGEGLQSVLTTTNAARSWHVLIEQGDYSRGAIKCLLKSIEAGDECEMVVLFPKSGTRATVCVSSQIGCAVGCRFCSTGTMGLRRNLSSHEILEQIYLARIIANRFNRPLRNAVFMGMGEPLHNCQALWESLEGMISEKGFGLSPRAITVSTAIGGRALIETAERFPNVRFALSLHSAVSGIRRELIPKSPSEIERLKEVLRSVNQLQTGSPVWLEVTLLKGINDRSEDVNAIAEFCEGLNVQINLIPYNSIADTKQTVRSPTLPESSDAFPLQGTELDSIYEIAHGLRSCGLVVRVRHSFGDRDQAACGQLVLAYPQPD